MRSRISMKTKQYNDDKKGQTMISKTLHIKQDIE